MSGKGFLGNMTENLHADCVQSHRRALFSVSLTAMTPSRPSETASSTYNGDDYDCTGAPIALTFEYGLVNDFLSDWCEMKTKLNNGEISPNEYSEWKITWPHA